MSVCHHHRHLVLHVSTMGFLSGQVLLCKKVLFANFWVFFTSLVVFCFCFNRKHTHYINTLGYYQLLWDRLGIGIDIICVISWDERDGMGMGWVGSNGIDRLFSFYFLYGLAGWDDIGACDEMRRI